MIIRTNQDNDLLYILNHNDDPEILGRKMAEKLIEDCKEYVKQNPDKFPIKVDYE